MANNPNTDPWSWYTEIPVVSRMYLTASVATTAACALDLVIALLAVLQLLADLPRGSNLETSDEFPILWHVLIRLPIPHVLFVQILSTPGGGRVPGTDGGLHRHAGVRGVCMVLLAPWISVHFLGSSLAFMMVYVWGRRNEGVRMSFLGLFPFTAPYLAWVLLAFSMVMGNPPTTDVVGICVGHSYYWLEYVYPKLAEIRGFRWKRPLAVPSVSRGRGSGGELLCQRTSRSCTRIKTEALSL